MDALFARPYVCGIGGIGTSGPAILLSQSGCCVAGSDLRQSELTLALQKIGISVAVGDFDSCPGEIGKVRRASCLIVPAAFPEDHRAVRIAQDLGIPVLTRTKALACIARAGRLGATLCLGTLARAQCARRIAALSPDGVGFCCGAALRGPNPGLHAKLGQRLVCDIDERDGFRDPGLLNRFCPQNIVISDFASPSFGYYAKCPGANDPALRDLVAAAENALCEVPANPHSCEKIGNPRINGKKILIFPIYSGESADYIRFACKIFDSNKAGESARYSDNFGLSQGGSAAHGNAGFLAAAPNSACSDPGRRSDECAATNIRPRPCRDESFAFRVAARNGKFILSPDPAAGANRRIPAALRNPAPFSGTQADLAACVAANLFADLRRRLDGETTENSNSESNAEHCPEIYAPAAENLGFAGNLALNSDADNIAFVGYFETIANPSLPRCRIFYDIRMHPVSVAQSLASVHALCPGDPVIIFIRPFISTLKFYTAQTWANALNPAQSVFILTPPYEGCRDGDCRSFAERLRALGLRAQCRNSAAVPPLFKGAILAVGAPDVRALFESCNASSVSDDLRSLS